MDTLIKKMKNEKNPTALHENVQMHIKWEWILKFNLSCDRMSLLKSVQMHRNGEFNDGN